MSVEEYNHRYVGRLAPSPTGAQHLGNARTFLIAWLLCRRANGQMLLRIEDLETPRIKPWAIEQAKEDLKWLELDWDIAPNSSLLDSQPIVQSQRSVRYAEILHTLKQDQAVYPCTCTRSDIETLSAPHESDLMGLVYPGTCANRQVEDAQHLDRHEIAYSWRYRMPTVPLRFTDDFLGKQSIESPSVELGDFIVSRKNGAIAYQLAVVIDDHDSGVNQVVRGDDLVLSTFRQLAIYSRLNWQPPRFCHLPLVVGIDGRRLAKRHGDTRLSSLRDAGIAARTIVGYLAFRSGLLDRFRPIEPHALLEMDPLRNLSRQACIFDSNNAIEFFNKLLPSKCS